jgi:adenine-specific DNA-methyltransferase
MTGLRDWKNECSSQFCAKKVCLSFLVDIVVATSAPLIFVSYNSDGIMKPKDVKRALAGIATMELHKVNQRRYKSDVSKNREYKINKLYEYLLVIRKESI